MNTKSQIIFRFLTIVFAITVFGYLPISAQNSADSEIVKLPSPANEKFEKATGLILPLVSSSCNWQNGKRIISTCNYVLFGIGSCKKGYIINNTLVSEIPNCYEISKEEFINGDRVLTSIYKEDGSPWFQFSSQEKQPNFYKKNTEIGFLPFAINQQNYYASPVLKLVAESLNWYEVEVNAESKAIKYISKKDSNWTKINWEYLLGREYYLNVKNRIENRLRDKPNGEIIEESSGLFSPNFEYLDKTDGDWVFVKGVDLRDKTSPKEYQGWIRWREGENLLIYIRNIAITDVTPYNNKPINGPDLPNHN